MFDHDTKVVLVNAIYFKAEWAKKFDESLTKEEPFHIISHNFKRQELVPMMKLEGDFKVTCLYIFIFFFKSKLSQFNFM